MYVSYIPALTGSHVGGTALVGGAGMGMRCCNSGSCWDGGVEWVWDLDLLEREEWGVRKEDMGSERAGAGWQEPGAAAG